MSVSAQTTKITMDLFKEYVGDTITSLSLNELEDVTEYIPKTVTFVDCYERRNFAEILRIPTEYDTAFRAFLWILVHMEKDEIDDELRAGDGLRNLLEKIAGLEDLMPEAAWATRFLLYKHFSNPAARKILKTRTKAVAATPQVGPEKPDTPSTASNNMTSTLREEVVGPDARALTEPLRAYVGERICGVEPLDVSNETLVRLANIVAPLGTKLLGGNPVVLGKVKDSEWDALKQFFWTLWLIDVVHPTAKEQFELGFILRDFAYASPNLPKVVNDAAISLMVSHAGHDGSRPTKPEGATKPSAVPSAAAQPKTSVTPNDELVNAGNQGTMIGPGPSSELATRSRKGRATKRQTKTLALKVARGLPRPSAILDVPRLAAARRDLKRMHLRAKAQMRASWSEAESAAREEYNRVVDQKELAERSLASVTAEATAVFRSLQTEASGQNARIGELRGRVEELTQVVAGASNLESQISDLRRRNEELAQELRKANNKVAALSESRQDQACAVELEREAQKERDDLVRRQEISEIYRSVTERKLRKAAADTGLTEGWTDRAVLPDVRDYIPRSAEAILQLRREVAELQKAGPIPEDKAAEGDEAADRALSSLQESTGASDADETASAVADEECEEFFDCEELLLPGSFPAIDIPALSVSLPWPSRPSASEDRSPSQLARSLTTCLRIVGAGIGPWCCRVTSAVFNRDNLLWVGVLLVASSIIQILQAMDGIDADPQPPLTEEYLAQLGDDDFVASLLSGNIRGNVPLLTFVGLVLVGLCLGVIAFRDASARHEASRAEAKELKRQQEEEAERLKSLEPFAFHRTLEGKRMAAETDAIRELIRRSYV
ncbi:uncharacterized protein L3040_004090 [Drepanopeziza brunnea f. sp. 'multigermtubi']|uniref:Uncharacterized protein n=1 Tax=Marssonina brunnea f. sp. multigermtubi (strain MB_m1) TaxID=1072389 RepID=K1X0W7_MARBU|nr:uncharacterized protein MBM_03098 [Drepanopeziza brunnea f. sp. 'multigermtubi' MB_m1]EKD18856.1 hypothetical protein MBM_03098 [Drepanopeziza brunnea f. sp. 'multigermtubi' MB_m1]KAJ5042691.1 hypothetical protein L3040_004090 [Drepanopeziza brunnea f. sp. 'multigermtubi']